MPTLKDFRESYPQYNDVPDGELLNKLRQKFPQKEWTNPDASQADQVNSAARTDQPGLPGYKDATDLVKSIGQGVRNGVTGLVGLPGEIREGVIWAADKLSGGFSPQVQAAVDAYRSSPLAAPTAQQVQQRIEPVMPTYQPQSVSGEWARTGAENLINAVAPGGLVRRAAMVAGPTAASELTREATRGTAAEQWAPGVAGLAGGVASAAGKVPSAGKIAAQAAPSSEKIKRWKDVLYKALDEGGVKYDANSWQQVMGDFIAKNEPKIDATLHPNASAVLGKIRESVKSGQSPDFTKMDTLRQLAGDAASTVNPDLAADRWRAGKMLDALDNFAENAPLITNGTIPADKVSAYAKRARELSSRLIKERQLKRMAGVAEGYASPGDMGTRAQFRGLTREIARREGRGWTPTERQAVKDVHKQGFAGIPSALSRGDVRPAFTGSVGTALLSPLLAPLGPFALLASAGLSGATTLGLKQIGERVTENAAQRVGGVVRSGRPGQVAAKAAQQAAIDDMMKRLAIILGTQAVQ